MRKFFTSTPGRRAATAAAVIGVAFILIYLLMTPLLIRRERQEINLALSAVFPSATGYESVYRDFKNEIDSVYAVKSGEDDETVIGYLYNINENGISSQLSFFVGLDTTGRVIGIYFPYFDEPVSYEDMNAVNSFLDSFKGKEGPLSGIDGTATLPGDITVIGGAEVTCYAIIDGVNASIHSFFDTYGQEVSE